MYKVIKSFIDIKEKYHPYEEGDVYPHEGAEASEERIAELSGSDNLQKTPLIEAAEDSTTDDKPTNKPAKKPKKKG